ncbi:MAG: 16S rRNA pseudouridine(516) synthase [Clostridia bacterium]|nr:16S rRNA pseudouridine(516) synthase [Clostridia bacterium]
MNLQRLDKIISSQLNISRKLARNDIHRGRVTVDGVTVRDTAFQVCADSAVIEYDGQAVSYKKFLYLVLNKPKGVLSASNDKTRQTVVDLVPEPLRRPDLAPVGRLDRDTTGLLLITDDGAFAHKIISPKSGIFKKYRVLLDGSLTKETAEAFEKGITLTDGTQCLPARLEILGESEAEVEICEGKYHQIKRMFGTVGLGVNELCRIKIGGLALPEDLPVGFCRELTAEELENIVKIT